MQLLGPDARKMYHAGFTASNAGSPQNVFGKAITAIPENLRFEKESDAEGFQRWTVRYDRVEYRNGQRTKATPMNVDVRFEWRPEMIQTQEERAWNTAGMRVASYNFYLRPGQ
jgi:type IV secretory pathway component VirB8